MIRERNPRGQGGRLRDEIVDAASALLEESGREDAITLRAVARRANITAPSIYAHFADRDAIMDAVLVRAFGELIDAIQTEMDGLTDPVERLFTGCHGYLRFARERPHRYRVLFGRRSDLESAPRELASVTSPVAMDELTGSEAFQILVDAIAACAAAGRSASTDPFADAAVLWSAMHGYATLNEGLPYFPWPDRDFMERAMIARVARLTD